MYADSRHEIKSETGVTGDIKITLIGDVLEVRKQFQHLSQPVFGIAVEGIIGKAIRLSPGPAVYGCYALAYRTKGDAEIESLCSLEPDRGVDEVLRPLVEVV